MSVSGFSLGVAQSCYVEFDVTTLTAGTVINSAGPPATTNAGTGSVATASLVVTAVALTGVVYQDSNRNGSKDSGEDWSAGPTVYVNLIQAGSVAYSTAVNAGTGNFTFLSLANGSYRVIVTTTATSATPAAPTGWVFINPTDGGQNISISTTLPSFPLYFGLYGQNAVRISGQVFIDNGNAGTNANNGVKDGSETAGLASVTLQLSNCAGTVYATTTTDAGGAYVFNAAPGAAPQNFCVTKTTPTGYVATGASVGATAAPQGGTIVTTPGTTTYRYCRETAAGLCGTLTDTIAFASSAGNVLYPNLNFGVVSGNQLTSDQTRVGEPGSFVDFPHLYRVLSYGTAAFSVTPVQTTPVAAIFTELIYRDTNCNGVLDAGESIVSGVAVTTGAFPALPAAVCLIVRQQIAPSVPYGAARVFRISAVFDYDNDNPALPPAVATVFNTDSTRISLTDSLQLVKAVRNCGASGSSCPATYTQSNTGAPNDILEYQITYINLGPQQLTVIVISDSTPPYTTFVSASASTPLPANLTVCNKTTPQGTTSCLTAQGAGGTGTVSWSFTGALVPGLSGAVTFRVKVDP